MKFATAGLALLVLAGCSTESLVSSAYPDREIYRFRNSDGSEVMSYVCDPGDSPEATQARAGQAHRFFDARLNAIAEKFANQIFDDVDSGAESDIPALTAELEASAERTAFETEERYQCLFVDGQEI